MKLISWIYPRRCALCDEVISSKELVCKSCLGKIRPLSGETCSKCGKLLQDTSKLYCYDCSRKIHYYDRGYAIFEYRDVKESLIRFKYYGRVEYARYYAMCAYSRYGDLFKSLKPDALIPVPIHKKREIKRGYNQAAVLAKELSKLFNIPVREDLIFRKKATIPLKKLDEAARINNLKKAFIIPSNSVKLDTIVIIDDIYTTGSTMDVMSRLFRECGVKKIYFLTVAIGRGL